MPSSNTFTTAPLILAADLADNPQKALHNAGLISSASEHQTALQAAIIFELNRFPGWPGYREPVAFEGREAALENAEARARQWEETTGKLLALRGFSIASYVANLRQLFLCRDIEATEARQVVEPSAATSKWYEQFDTTLRLLRDPVLAIQFALDHVPPFMVRDFMDEWREDRAKGTDVRVRHQLEGLREDILCGQVAASH